ncbi:MAG: hypothetical protein AABX01_08210 [Candidatus Micrarchaeota archaeon]
MSDQLDLETAFASAGSLLGKGNYPMEVRFYPYAGLKSTIQLKGGKVIAKVSDGYQAAEVDSLTGLALDLMIKLFRVRGIDERTEIFLSKFRSLNGKGVYDLHESLRSRRGRKRKGSFEGEAYNLQPILDKVAGEYSEIFTGVEKPSILWSRHVSHRRLAFYDTAFNQIVVSKKFDSLKAPEFFLEYLIFHELLHAKHDAKYGKRRRVHHREFHLDERKFSKYGDAMRMMDRA